MQTSACADAHDGECSVLRFLCAGVEVDVGKSVEFCQDDVDVVASNARGENCDSLALIGAGDAVELAAANLAFFLGKVFSYGVDSARITYKDDAVSELFGTQMEVER